MNMNNFLSALRALHICYPIIPLPLNPQQYGMPFQHQDPYPNKQSKYHRHGQEQEF